MLPPPPVLPWPFSRSADEGIRGLQGSQQSLVDDSQSPFVKHDASFDGILGSECKLELVQEKDWAWAHEAGVYIPSRNSIFVTSNILKDDSEERIVISEVSLADHSVTHYTHADIPIRMANGGTNYKDGILFCEQGFQSQCPSSLTYVSFSEEKGKFKSEPIINNFHGRAFNSLNDVVVHAKSGTLWFTDPNYGHEQNFKPEPELPCQAYSFDPSTNSIRVVANGIPKCNGIAFSPDWKTCYITDTSYISGTGTKDPQKGGWIYAFDVRYEMEMPIALQNKRVFAFTDAGAPDGIKCDTHGNVFAGCFDGVHVWSSNGQLVGKIILPNNDGCANLVFGPPGSLYIMAEKRLYRAKLAAEGNGVKEL